MERFGLQEKVGFQPHRKREAFAMAAPPFYIDESRDMCYHDTDFSNFLRQNHGNKLE